MHLYFILSALDVALNLFSLQQFWTIVVVVVVVVDFDLLVFLHNVTIVKKIF